MKKIITMLFLIGAATLTATASSYFWYSDGDMGEGEPDYEGIIYAQTGKAASLGDAVMIFKSSEERAAGTWYQDLVIYDDLTVGGEFSGDVQMYTGYVQNDLDWKYIDEDASLDDGYHYYTVLFDSSTVQVGTQFIVLDKTTVLLNNSTGNGDYGFLAENGDYSGIQWNTVEAVPTTYPPEVILTTTDLKVDPATTTYAISGTANSNVVGSLSWSNALNTTSGMIPTAASWTINGVPLDEGPNQITVAGTNAVGIISKQTVTITRQEMSTSPWFQGFETDTPTSWAQADTWPILQGADLVGTDPGNDSTPEFQTVRSHLESWQSVNEPTDSSALLELDEISIAGLTGTMTLTAHLSATTLDEGFAGLMNGDSVKFYVALNGAEYSATPDIEIQGKGATSGVLWGYDATGVAATAAGSPMVFQPAREGELADGYATVQISIPAGTSAVKMKAVAGINAEIFSSWNIDDISLAEGGISLQITDIEIGGGEVSLAWQGGAADATHYVETRQDLVDTNETWSVLYTAPPATTNYSYAIPSNNALFYRVRGEN